MCATCQNTMSREMVLPVSCPVFLVILCVIVVECGRSDEIHGIFLPPLVVPVAAAVAIAVGGAAGVVGEEVADPFGIVLEVVVPAFLCRTKGREEVHRCSIAAS